MNKLIPGIVLVLVLGTIPYSFAQISMNGVHVTTQYGGDIAFDNKVNCWDSIWIYLTFQPGYLTCSIPGGSSVSISPGEPEPRIEIPSIIDAIPKVDFYIHPDDLMVILGIGLIITIIFLVMKKRRNKEVHVKHY